MDFFVFLKISFHIVRRKYNSDTKFHWRLASYTIAVKFLFLFLAMIPVPNNHIVIENQCEKIVETHSEELRLKSSFSNTSNMPGTQQESTYSAVPQEREKNRQDAVESVTKDSTLVAVDITILWSLDLSSERSICREYRTLDNVRTKLLRPTSRKIVRDYVAAQDFEEARTSNRAITASCAKKD